MPKKHKIAFLFPGQGSQYPGMAKDFYENMPLARQTFEEANDLLHYKLSSIILNGPADLLTETKNSQTGIYVVSTAILRVLSHLFPELRPAICSGLSLGEYTALSAAGKLKFSDALPLVAHRGQFMNEACESHPGFMSVVLGLDADSVENLVKEINLPNDLWAANFNSPGQVVVSGTRKGIETITAIAPTRGAKRILPLQVHGAFHSGLMKTAEEKLADYILQAPIQETPIDLVMNVPGDTVANIHQIKEYLIRQVTSPVRWEQGVRQMVQSGVDLFIEIGCGKALSGFNKRICSAIPTISIEKIEDIDHIQHIL